MAISIPRVFEINDARFTIEKRDLSNVPDPFAPEDMQKLVVEICLHNNISSSSIRRSLEERESQLKKAHKERLRKRAEWQRQHEQKQNDPLHQLVLHFKGKSVPQYKEMLNDIIAKLSRKELEALIQRADSELESSPHFNLDEFKSFLAVSLAMKPI